MYVVCIFTFDCTTVTGRKSPEMHVQIIEFYSKRRKTQKVHPHQTSLLRTHIVTYAQIFASNVRAVYA